MQSNKYSYFIIVSKDVEDCESHDNSFVDYYCVYAVHTMHTMY